MGRGAASSKRASAALEGPTQGPQTYGAEFSKVFCWGIASSYLTGQDTGG